MPIVRMPDGQLVNLPDNPTPEQLAALEEVSGGKERTTAQEVGRQLGLTARAAVKGVTGIPVMMGDALRSAENFMRERRGLPPAETYSQMLDQGLNKVGLPQPENAVERIAGDTASAMAGGAAALSPNRQMLQLISAGTGGGAAATTREAGGGPVAQLTAGLAGALAPGGARAAVEPGVRIANRLIEPMTQRGRESIKGRLLADLAGERKDDVLKALRQNKQFVPGAQNTAATAAAPAGSTELAAAEKLLGQRFAPSEYADIAALNEAARLNAVRSVGKTPQALEAAEKTRSAVASFNYRDAFGEQIKADPKLAVMFKNPFVRKALPDALELAQANGINPKEKLPQFLHYLKLSMDKALEKTGDSALSKTERLATETARNRLVGWLEAKDPAYAAARTNFANNSKPINQMQVGQELEKALKKPLDAGERPTVFANAMREAPRTIKRATGGPRFQQLEDVLEPQQVQALQGVEQDLARQALVKQQATAGATAAQRKLGAAFQPIEPPGMLNRGVTLLRAGLERLQSGTTERVLNELAHDMRSPQRIEQLLANASPREKLEIMMLLQQLSAAGSRGAVQTLPQIGNSNQ